MKKIQKILTNYTVKWYSWTKENEKIGQIKCKKAQNDGNKHNMIKYKKQAK